MKQLVIAACIGSALSLAAAPAFAQEPAKKAVKKAPAKSKKEAAKEVAKAPAGVKWDCELGNTLYIDGNMLRDEILTVHWKGADYKLPRQPTVTGADRYFDARSGLDLVVIPTKAMLFNKNAGQRLTDDCKTAEMLAGAPAPTQAGALRAPVTQPLMAAPLIAAPAVANTDATPNTANQPLIQQQAPLTAPKQ